MICIVCVLGSAQHSLNKAPTRSGTILSSVLCYGGGALTIYRGALKVSHAQTHVFLGYFVLTNCSASMKQTTSAKQS